MMKKLLYQKVLKPVLFKFDPDSVHDVFVKAGKLIGKNALGRKALGAFYGPPSGKFPVVVDGIEYQGRVLLSAGFDYNAYLAPVLWDMGFAGEEVGSVSAKKCEGNPAPNLRRLIKSKSIQVYKGLRNDGVDTIIKRIKKMSLPEKFVLGISIARTNSVDCADEEKGVEDYLYSYKRLNEEDVGHFYTINISCPNAFGGEDFAQPLLLKKLLTALKTIPSKKPLYFKMPINKPWEEFKTLLNILHESGVNGVVIGNLNKNYDEVDFPEEIPPGGYRGGLSGRPCQARSNELIKKTRETFPNMTIFGCGGILEPKDALEKLALGANLVQLITGMIFNGPHLINEINRMVEKEKV